MDLGSESWCRVQVLHLDAFQTSFHTSAVYLISWCSLFRETGGSIYLLFVDSCTPATFVERVGLPSVDDWF
jgi:hypothetical protein